MASFVSLRKREMNMLHMLSANKQLSNYDLYLICNVVKNDFKIKLKDKRDSNFKTFLILSWSFERVNMKEKSEIC